METDQLCQYINQHSQKKVKSKKTTSSIDTNAFSTTSQLDDTSMVTQPTDDEDNDDDQLCAEIQKRFT